MSDQAKSVSRSIFLDTHAAQINMQQLTVEADKLKAKLDGGTLSGDKLNKTLAKLDETKKTIKDLEQQLANGLKPTLIQQEGLVRKLSNELRRMSANDPAFASKLDEYKKQNAELRAMRDNIYQVEQSQKHWLNDAKAVAFGVSIANIVRGAITWIKQGIASMIEFNSKFENSVANLSAITGASGADLDFLKRAAIDLSTSGAKSATDYVEAMKLIGSAKPELLSQKEALVDVTKAAKLLSEASGLELPDAATRLTDALNQYGAPAKDAAKYVDALAAASKYGAAEIPQITDALLQFGAVAKSSNINIYESAGAIELLAEKGLKGAEAGTKLRNVFLRMAASEGLPKEAIEALKAAGVNTDILSNKTLSLEERLKEFSKIQNNATALEKVFGEVNYVAGQILLQNIPRYAELTAQVKEQGVANKQAAVNTDTLSNQWERLKNILASKFLSGSNDLLKGLVRSVTSLVEPTKNSSDQLKEMGATVQRLEKDILPLTDRYDKLKEKAKQLGGESKLSKNEQVELNKAINTIASSIPSAIIQWDKYGNAIGISTDKAREFISLQQNILKVKNKEQIDDFKKQLKDLNKQLTIKQNEVGEVVANDDPQNPYSDAYIKRFAHTEADIIKGQERRASYINGLKQDIIQIRNLVQGVQGNIDELSGTTLESKLKVTPPATTKTGNNNNNNNGSVDLEAEQRKREELLRDVAEFNKKLHDLKFQSGQATKTEDEKEIAAIKEKYARIFEEYKGLAKKISGTNIHLGFSPGEITDAENAELQAKQQALKEKHDKENAEAFQKRAKDEYDLQIANNAKYFEGLKTQQAKSFVDGIVDKTQYEANIAAIDEAAKKQNVQTAWDYAMHVKEAAADVTKFEKQELDKQTANLLAAFAKREENRKLLQELDEQAARTQLETAVKLTLPGTEAHHKAVKELLDWEYEQEVKALEKKREADLNSIEQQYNQELQMLKDQLEVKRKVELALVDENAPDADKKKAAINNRFDNAIGDATEETRTNKINAAIRLNDDINNILSALNKKHKKDQDDADLQSLEDKINRYIQYTQAALDIYSKFAEAKTNKENAALKKELKENDLKKAALKKQLDNKFISQQQYNAKVAGLDAEADRKKQELEKKQFERNKRIQIAQALINGAQAVMKTIAEFGAPIPPNFLSIAAVALDAVVTGAEVLTISKQKYGKGGRLTGPSHSSGGMPVINPVTGQKEAEVEGGEYILSKATVANNKELADKLLHASMYEGGRKITKFGSGGAVGPFWKTRAYERIDVPKIMESMRVVKYAEGGVMAKPNSNTAAAETTKQEVVIQTDPVLTNAIERLNDHLDAGIRSSVSLLSLEEATALKARIRKDAGLR
jgi:TP901 family phage tail tape measure protein